ncbi:hypothetical protein [Nannocystis pusilla]|uniref:hypothetical protein n=1 Tax=Nannocystis pusilla TaxID=889268 RepID=UPI003B7EEBBC
MDLCQFTTEAPPLAERTWGVISGAFTRSDGAGDPATAARSIRSGFGSVIVPQKNHRLVVLSTGTAADAKDKKPAFSPSRAAPSWPHRQQSPPTGWRPTATTSPTRPAAPSPAAARPARTRSS